MAIYWRHTPWCHGRCPEQKLRSTASCQVQSTQLQPGIWSRTFWDDLRLFGAVLRCFECSCFPHMWYTCSLLASSPRDCRSSCRLRAKNLASKKDCCAQLLATCETCFNASHAVDLPETEFLDDIPLGIHLGSNNWEELSKKHNWLAAQEWPCKQPEMISVPIDQSLFEFPVVPGYLLSAARWTWCQLGMWEGLSFLSLTVAEAPSHTNRVSAV